jgi:Glycine-zipper domain
MKTLVALSSIGLLLLGGCTTMPTGPSALVLPGTGKTFEQFRADDYVCRQYAQEQVGGVSANQAAANSGVESAAVGTVVGAAAGALIGGHRGAGAGAGVGLLMGSASGAGAAQDTGYNLQRRYDFSYQQCMYLKGNRIPVSGRFATPYYEQQESTLPPPPPPGTPPPPPPGTPPPPPPGVSPP